MRKIWIPVWFIAVVCGGRSEGARVLFDFGAWTSGNTFTGWNSVGSSQANVNGFLLSSVRDNNDIPTSLALRIVDAFQNSPARLAYSPAPYGASSTAFFPARSDATGYNWYIAQDDADHSVSIRIEGLYPAQTYNFTFYASSAVAGPQYVGKYIIGSQSVTLDPGNNVNNTVTISNVTPDSNGYVTISLDFGADSSVAHRYCFLGAMAIDGNFGMSAADAQTFQYYTNAWNWYSGLTPANRTTVINGTQVSGILSPYTAIIRQGDNFTLATSTIRFSNSVFPDSINILGDEVLSSPISLDTGATGTAGAVAITATDQEVDLVQTITYPQYSLSIQNQLLYDGLMIVTLNFSAPSPATISKAELKISLPQTMGKYGRYENFPQDKLNWKFGFGPIPQPGETVTVKYSLLNGQYPNGWNPTTSASQDAVFWQWNNGFLPFVWIGNEEKGIGWASESDKGWSYNSTDTLAMMERKSGAVVTHLSFITNPLTITGTRQIQFLLQVTPPKPFPADWCNIEMTPYDVNTFIPSYQNLTEAQKQHPVDDPATSGNLASDYYTIWSYGCGSPDVVDPANFLLGFQASHYYGYEPLPYLNLTSLALNSKDGYYYGVVTREWAQKPYTSYIDSNPIHSIVNTCVRSFCAPWLAWRVGYMIDQDNISGIYFDNCGIQKCSNYAHGCGYVNDSGTYQPTLPFLGARNFLMMTRSQFLTRGKRPYIFCHAGDYPAEISFADFNLTGEGFYGLDAIANITLGEMRAMMLGLQQQTGSLRVFQPQMTYDPSFDPADEGPTRRLLALTLLHGTKVWPIFCNKTPVLNSWTVLKNLSRTGTTLVPYWKWAAANQTLNASSVYATLYSNSPKAVLAVSNLSTSPQTVQIPAAALQAQVPGTIQASDPMDNQTVTLDQNGLTLTVAAKDFRLILLQGQAVVTMTGLVQPQGYAGDLQDLGVKVELRQNGTAVRTERMRLTSAGQFTLSNVTAGTYDIAIKVGGWLQTVLTNYSINQDPQNVGTISLIGGDRNGDNQVNAEDLAIVLTNMDLTGN